MKYASIDLETTGLDPETCKTIEIGMILDDLSNPRPIASLPAFHCYVDCGIFTGQARALAMHAKIFERIASKAPEYHYLCEESVGIYISDFLRRNGYGRSERVNPAGKNFASFDANFLKKLPGLSKEVFFSHRVIDPAMLYWNPMTDKALPDTKTCYERAGIREDVAHTALDDARGVIKLLRAKFCAVQD